MHLKIVAPDLLHQLHELQEDISSDFPGPLKVLAAVAGGLGGRFRGMIDQHQQGRLHEAAPEPLNSAHEVRCVTPGSMKGRKAASQFVLAALPGSSGMFKSAEDCTVVILSDTLRHITAGTAARTMAQAFIHPIDTIKTRMQAMRAATAPLKLQKWRKSTKLQPMDIYLGRRRVMHLRNWLVKGPKDVYLGLTGAVLGTIPTAFLYFWAYEWCKKKLEARKQPHALTHILSASAGAIVSAVVRVPTDTLKHRVQAYVLPNIWQGAQTLIVREGVLGLYKGFLPTLLRDVPEIALQFMMYEQLRRRVQAKTGKEKLPTWQHLVLGGASGATAALATMPLDFAKTVLQCGTPMPVHEVFIHTLKEKGVGGLFTGLGPRVTQVAVMSAVFFTLFEFWKSTLKFNRADGDRALNQKLWTKDRNRVVKRQFVL